MTTQPVMAACPTRRDIYKARGRIEWIDIAKGLGIVLVSFGHLRNGDSQSVRLPALDPLITVICLFHMPLFYLLGGLTFSMRNGLKAFLVRKVKTLLIPYYVFSLYFLAKPLAVLLIPSIRTTFRTEHDYDLTQQFVDVLIMGNGLWFLMAFFMAEIFMYGLVSIIKCKYDRLCAIGIALIIGTYMFNDTVTVLPIPFQIWQGIGITGFMIIGYVLREWMGMLGGFNSVIYATGCFILLVACAWIFFLGLIPTSVIWTIRLFTAIAGSFAFTFLCIAIAKCNWLAHIGRASLVFYSLNALTINVVKFVYFRLINLNMIDYNFIIQFVVGIFIVVSALALLCFENFFVQKYIPWVIGKKRINLESSHIKQLDSLKDEM